VRVRERRWAAPTVAAAIVGALALPAAGHTAAGVVVTGTYRTLHADTRDGGRRVDALIVDGKAFALRLPRGSAPRSGATVRVTGDSSGSLLAATDVREIAPPRAVAASGGHRLLVINVVWGGQTLNATQDTARAFVFGTTDPQRRSTAQYYQDVSYGQFALTGDVTPILTIADPGDCTLPTGSYAIALAADAAATGAGFAPSAYDNVMYNVPESCGTIYRGLGEVSGPRTWVVGGLWNLGDGYARMVPAHELGHNLGLWHGHGLECGAQIVSPACLASSSSLNEYGSSYDLMGNNWTSDGADSVNWLAFPQELSLGWIDGRFTDVNQPAAPTGQDLTVVPIERSTGVVGLRISTSRRVYYVEYRQPLSQDAYLSAFSDATHGVLVSMRNDLPFGDPGPVNLDTAPNSTVDSPYGWSCVDLAAYCDFFDAALNPGQTFADVDGAFSLRVTSVGASGATVRIEWGNAGGSTNWAAQSSVDFDGDHKTDLAALYRGQAPDSLWYAPGRFQIFFGATSDVPVPGDYNGDGKTDAVIFRPSTGLWYGPATALPQIVIQMNLGQTGDVPVPGDYDGDGKTDPAIYRPSTGLFFAVLSGGGTKSSTFGASGDVPVPRDYDGDGKTDFAIYRQNATPDHLGLWYAPLSGGGVYQIYFGAPGDVPVPGDYNGDGRAEAVIFRQASGLWYGPFNGATGLFQLSLGGPGDVPIPGYYDGDLAQDPAVYHRANGLWFALLSGGGTSQTTVGAPGDVPMQKRPALAGGL